MMMKTIVALLLFIVSMHTGHGFCIPRSTRIAPPRPLFVAPSTQTSPETNAEVSNIPMRNLSSAAAGLVTGITGLIGQGVAADEYELAELPPPYIPALFGLVLLVGVGVLTSSLGNVMDEEASLGMQSGARAKKEIERSRSSYFGKRK